MSGQADGVRAPCGRLWLWRLVEGTRAIDGRFGVDECGPRGKGLFTTEIIGLRFPHPRPGAFQKLLLRETKQTGPASSPPLDFFHPQNLPSSTSANRGLFYQPLFRPTLRFPPSTLFSRFWLPAFTSLRSLDRTQPSVCIPSRWPRCFDRDSGIALITPCLLFSPFPRSASNSVSLNHPPRDPSVALNAPNITRSPGI